MMSPLVDINVVVATMRLAATVVPVPEVFDLGHSGNCSYLIMEYIDGFRLSDISEKYPLFVLDIIAPQIEAIVRNLASVGLAHNNLEPCNILIGESWQVVSVIDWDLASSSDTSMEYLKCAAQFSVSGSPQWNRIFLRYPPQQGRQLDINPVDGGWAIKSHCPPLVQAPISIKSETEVLPPLKSLSFAIPSKITIRIAIIISKSGTSRLV